MFFVLSKLFYFFIQPLNWVLVCAVLFAFAKNKRLKTIAKWSGLAIFLVFSNGFLYRACVLAWQPKVAVQTPAGHYKLGVVLSGVTIMNQKKETFFGGTADRFIQICKLYHTGTVEKILLSGGDGSLAQNRPKESDFLRRELLAQGVPDSVILVENQSRNTHENAVESNRILDSVSITGPVILVTSALHMRRSMACFARQGVAVVPFVANFEVIENHPSFGALLIPDLLVLRNWQYFLKEMLGLVAYTATGKA